MGTGAWLALVSPDPSLFGRDPGRLGGSTSCVRRVRNRPLNLALWGEHFDYLGGRTSRPDDCQAPSTGSREDRRAPSSDRLTPRAVRRHRSQRETLVGTRIRAPRSGLAPPGDRAGHQALPWRLGRDPDPGEWRPRGRPIPDEAPDPSASELGEPHRLVWGLCEEGLDETGPDPAAARSPDVVGSRGEHGASPCSAMERGLHRTDRVLTEEGLLGTRRPSPVSNALVRPRMTSNGTQPGRYFIRHLHPLSNVTVTETKSK